MRRSYAGSMAKAFLAVAIVVFGLLASESRRTMDDTWKTPAVAKPLLHFSGRLLDAISKQDANKNIIASPISIHQAISMVLLGSDSGSQTRQEILSTIGYSELSDAEVERCHQSYADIMTEFARITNKTREERREYDQKSDAEKDYQSAPQSPVLDLFTMMVTKNQGQARPEYESAIKKFFKASISSIDDQKPETKTALLNKLNDWGKQAGFDNPILEQGYLDDGFEALLIAAIQLEAFWFDEFHEQEGENIFYNYGFKDKPARGKYLSNGNVRGQYIEFVPKDQARYKSRYEEASKNEAFKRLSSLNFHAVNVLLHGSITFTIIEPRGDDSGPSSSSGEPNAKLNKLMRELLVESEADQRCTKLNQVLGLFDDHFSYDLDFLKMPKFKFDSDADLKPVLRSMGLKRAFDDVNAQISNITMNQLHIRDVRHKAVIETTKTGIKAAAITVIKMSLLSAFQRMDEEVKVTIENPFLFVLRYKDVPLFVGRLTNLPESGAK